MSSQRDQLFNKENIALDLARHLIRSIPEGNGNIRLKTTARSIFRRKMRV